MKLSCVVLLLTFCFVQAEKPTSDRVDFSISDVKQRVLYQQKILVLGGTGSGKSSLIQHLLHNNYGEMDLEAFKNSGQSVTQNIRSYESDLLTIDGGDYQFTLYDTVGLGSHEFTAETILKQIDDKIFVQDKIDKILIVARMERFRPKIGEDLRQIMAALKQFGAPDASVYFILTHTDPWKEKVINDYVSNFLLEHQQIKVAKDRILPLCFAKLTEIDEGFLPVYQRLVKDSKSTLLRHLMKKTPSFQPLSVSLKALKDKKAWFP